MSPSLHLVPPLYETGDLKGFVESGQSISFSLSPRSNGISIFPTPLNCIPKVQAGRAAQEQDVYVASWDKPPASERRVFVTDTSVIFTACQQFKNVSQSDGHELVRSPEVISTFRKLATDFIVHAKDCWVYSSQLMASTENPPQYPGDHYKSLYTSLSLFQTLYLPEDGIEDVPVGDELLEWLNTHFIEPSSEEGDQLSSLDRPWEDEVFWPYVVRATLRGLMKSATFFLRSLNNHPSDNLQRISGKLIDLLEKHPRQRHFSTEKEFFTTSRRWKDRVKVLRIELDRVPEDDRSDEYENWWDNISDLLGILEGRADVFQRVCSILGGGWKEVVCAYGIWVDVGLRRADLPDIAGRIMTNVPPDPTDAEDVLLAELVQGRPTKALSIAAQIDPWLAAHLSDIMVPLGLLNSEAENDSGTEIRDHYIRAYADYLNSDPGLWRLTVVYLFSCGEIGKRMADEVLLRVPLNLNDTRTAEGKGRQNVEDATMEVEEDVGDGDGDLSGTVKELNATCYEFHREQTRRMICRIASRKLISSRKYGLAISYCRSAEDWTMLGNIVDKIMEEYILHGPVVFIPLVVDIAPSLHELRATPGPHVIFVQRLMFAVRYAEFHQRAIIGDTENAALDLLSLFEENLAPRTWWGVLLHDAVSFVQDGVALSLASTLLDSHPTIAAENLYLPSEGASLLLRRLEEVTMRTRQGCGDDYLGILARILEVDGPREALRRLDVLRLALARYLARCTVNSRPVSIGLSSHDF